MYARRPAVKKLMLCLMALAGSALYGQNISGDWQGVLKVGTNELRTVIKISLQDDKLAAMMFVIEQPGPGIKASAITKDGSSIKIAVAAIGGNYDGKLNADGKSITGTWAQGGLSLPLNLERATPATAWAIPEPPPPAKVMDAKADPSFEVATIKPSKPEERFSLLVNRSGMLNTTNTSVSDLIKFAYDLHPKQIVGGQAWVESEKYDVTGKPDTAGLPSINQLKIMVRKLLADRFQLAYHLEKKELSVYAITVAKGGAKITKDETDPNGLPGFGGPPQRGFNVRNSTISEFASILQANILDRPVVDQTGFGPARYNFVLKWTPDAALAAQSGGGAGANAAPAAGDPDAPPDIFTAFQQQLGLRIEATKAPVDVLVVDKIEKPSGN
jgi:uncharacterized protein (TIGR03435 family)